MSDTTSLHFHADRALARIKKLAEGNGFDLSSLVVFDIREEVITIRGKIEVAPLCNTETALYPGGPRRKMDKRTSSDAEMQELVSRHREMFCKERDWIADVVKELQAYDFQGWGLESAKVMLPAKSAIFAVTQPCPRCQGRKFLVCEECKGQGFIVCPQCAAQYQGQYHGHEPCYHCYGRGEDPQRPGQPCPVCHGTRFAPCRQCQARGTAPCPACHGSGGMACPNCKGTGAITQEIKVNCGVETFFTVSYGDLPSGALRGLDRIGVANLGKGHADIKSYPPPKKEDEDKTPQAKELVLIYEASWPYAELKMSFSGKKAVVSSVGKQGVLTGIPTFLDKSLKPWREKLSYAAQGKGPLEDALKARALKEFFLLAVAGKGTEKEARKLYPFGVSSEALAEIMNNMCLALKKATLSARAMGALISFAASAVFFYAFFMMGMEADLARSAASSVFAILIDLGALIAALVLSWGVLNFITSLALSLRFGKTPLALRQTIGKIGVAMLAGTVALYALFAFLAPVKPVILF